MRPQTAQSVSPMPLTESPDCYPGQKIRCTINTEKEANNEYIGYNVRISAMASAYHAEVTHVSLKTIFKAIQDQIAEELAKLK